MSHERQATPAVRAAALALTAVTGFAGLVYEVAWQRYLATLLGAHSEATAAVLAIFLGGLSAGYALFGAVTRAWVAGQAAGRRPSLLVLYGGVEAAIGVYALLFPWLFRAAQQVSLWLPGGGGVLGFAADVALSAALIGPPSVLMGGTIPILTQALSRDLDDATRLHARVYALNTVGAFAGALAAAFALVPWLGLDNVARAMGLVNLVAGACYAALGARPGAGAPVATPAAPVATAADPALRHYGAVALLVGFGAMTCQAILIRIGGLTLGSSEFTFAMVVAACVLAIAVGSLAVSALPRVGAAVLPAALWGLVIGFGLLYTRLDEAPYWGHVLRTHFASSPQSFHPFYAAAFAATLTVIGPIVALSGAVLPLCFDAMREEFGDLGAKAGRLYSQNTIGSLLGALLGGYALLFWLDLHHVFRIALAAFALAAALVTARRFTARPALGALALALPAFAALAWLRPWDPAQLSAGHFRYRQTTPWTGRGPAAAPLPGKILLHDDDPTSTVVALQGTGESVSIFVNGKSDGNTTFDRNTMALAALVPALLVEEPVRAFVIGFGTGITAGTLAAIDDVRSVTVAEISPGVVSAAPFFDFANGGASHHPKIHFVQTDAYRALRRSDERFDVIISEPSNPWVAGVEMLWSREFLRAARDRLAPGGVYVQWFHTYESNNRTVQLLLRTFAQAFDHVSIWRPQATDVLLIGRREGAGPPELARLEQRAQRPDVSAALAQVGIHGLPELLVHECVPLGVLAASGAPGAPIHSLFHPRLSYEAGRAFFVGRRARLPFFGDGETGAAATRASLLREILARGADDALWDAIVARACEVRLPHCPTLIAAWASAHAGEPGVDERIARWRAHAKLDMAPELIAQLRSFYDPDAPPAVDSTPAGLTKALGWYLDHYYAALPFSPRALVSLWRHCRVPGVPGFCEQGLANAEQFEATGVLPERWRGAYERVAE